MVNRNTLIILVILLIFLLLVLLFIRVTTDKLIFMPRGRRLWEPDTKEYPHNKIMIENRLSAWHFNRNQKNRTILFCHGNYGNISDLDFIVELCSHYHVNLLVFDYSGYGESHGHPSQKAVNEDGVIAYNYLLECGVEPEDIILWGYSLGGAVATYVATQVPVFCLILMSTFSSLDDVIGDREISPLLIYLARGLTYVVDNMESKSRIPDVKCPIYILHSRDDELIPYTNAVRLYQSIKGKKKFYEIGGSHIGPDLSKEIIIDLFKQCGVDTYACPDNEILFEKIRNLPKRYS